MILVVAHATSGEQRRYGVPRRGTLSLGAAREGDVVLTGHNIAARHVVLTFGPKGRIAIEVRSTYGVSRNGLPPKRDDLLGVGDVLAIGAWEIHVEPLSAASAAPSAQEDAFLDACQDDPDTRLVYADWLEEQGRIADAELVRAAELAEVAELAARSDPAWRRRYLRVAIESCDRQGDPDGCCPGHWGALQPTEDPDVRACAVCDRAVAFAFDIASARRASLKGAPVAIDPAVPRRADDLREAARKRPAIEMGRPAR